MKKTTHKLLAATLLLGGSLTGIHSAIAQSTPAGTTINNRATATYSDGTTTYDATSNTVTITVAEVPGVNVTAQTPNNPSPNAGGTTFVDFVITNVGNDPTQFFIPGTATLSDAVNFSIPAGTPLKIVAVNGTPFPIASQVNIPSAGDTTGNLLGATDGSLAPNPGGASTIGTITVRVPIQVSGTALANATTTVSLGNTTSPNAQNVDRAGDIDTNDVYTVDNPNTATNETAGVLTQESEAMATSAAITVDSRLQAFAAILKAVSSYSNNNTPALLSDDSLNYALALRVDDPNPAPTGLAPSDLHPTLLNLDGGTNNESHVLISDAIPANTQLSSANPVAPSGWTAVYTASPTSIPAHRANWNRTRPGGTITRVGFISATAIARGATVSGFSFTVNPLSGFTGGQIANIAQVFGQSQPGATVAGTSTQLVYDESGDQSANNELQGNNPDPTSGGAPATGFGIGDGVANPAVDGIDPGKGTNPTDTTNTNQGATFDADPSDTDGGEVVVFTIAATPLNGPDGRPDAVNTTNNDDFTNKSIVPPVGLDPATALTDAQTPATSFTNTVQNTSGSPQTISLLPTPPSNAGDLPDGTIVTITAGSDVARYRYDGTNFVFQPTGSTNTSATDPVKLVNIPANDNAPGGSDQVNYTVSIDLPGGVAQLDDFPVPILSFVDENNDGSPTNEPGNTTIDRLYTGYVRLEKDARILDVDGTTEVVGFTTNQATLGAAARPRRIIEYRIRYSNISTSTPANSGSVILPANTLSITEDGLATPNNWFNSTDDAVSGIIPGSALDPGGTITGTSNGSDLH
jgi:hypothetical protein